MSSARAGQKIKAKTMETNQLVLLSRKLCEDSASICPKTSPTRSSLMSTSTSKALTAKETTGDICRRSRRSGRLMLHILWSEWKSKEIQGVPGVHWTATQIKGQAPSQPLL